MSSPSSLPALALPAMLDMRGRRVMVTGAAGGMGRETAKILSTLGADLALVDVQAMDETVEILAGTGAVTQHRGDLSDDSFVDGLIADGPYFAMAHCAAIFNPPADMPSDAGFDKLMRINVRAPLRLAQGVIKGMSEQGEGFVVMVGSAAGQHGGIMTENDDPRYAEYAASKGGVHTLVKWLARRAVKSGVMVNGVAPGLVTSTLNQNAGITFDPKEMFMPLGRAGRLEELGWPIAMLCTPAASFVAGVVLNVNGGSYVP